VQLLLDHGADHTITNDAGETALEAALTSSDHRTEGNVDLLVAAGAVCPTWTAAKGDRQLAATFLTAMCDDEEDFAFPVHSATLVEQPGAVIALCKAGFDIDARSPDAGYTPLMDAACFCSPELVKTLLDLDADVRMVTDTGCSALDLAKRKRRWTLGRGQRKRLKANIRLLQAAGK